MSREPGSSPRFRYYVNEVVRAEMEWNDGNKEKSVRVLKLIASVIESELVERDPNDPVPE